MARLLLLFVAAMILAAHASLIPGVSQFLKTRLSHETCKTVRMLPRVKRTMLQRFLLLSGFPLLASNVLPAKTKTEWYFLRKLFVLNVSFLEPIRIASSL